MKYAIFSDIHGNYPALVAALADARAQGADTYLFLGDYASLIPWGNDVVNVLRQQKNSYVIRGNGEDYFIAFKHKNKADMTDEQMKPIYWGYNSLSPENLMYLSNLPEKIVISSHGTNIHMAHTMDFFYHPASFFYAYTYEKMMRAAPISHDEYLVQGRAALLTCPKTLAKIDALPEGIYLLGHNHAQFHMEYEGRLFINPGSCGMAVDWNPTAAYTILSYENDSWMVCERRVMYDLDALTAGMDTSGFTAYAPVWSDVLKHVQLTGKDYFVMFVNHIGETAKLLGYHEHPVSQEVWDIAVASWDMDALA